jgi:hypothetical protein
LNVKNQEIAAEHQKIAAESNKALVTLTHDTVDDSSTVKTITFITLFYLPASFTSVGRGVALFLFYNAANTLLKPVLTIIIKLGFVRDEPLQIRRFLGFRHVTPDLDICSRSGRTHGHDFCRLDYIRPLPKQKKEKGRCKAEPCLSL